MLEQMLEMLTVVKATEESVCSSWSFFDRLSAAYRNLPSQTECLDLLFGDYDHHSEHNVQRTKTTTPGRHQS